MFVRHVYLLSECLVLHKVNKRSHIYKRVLSCPRWLMAFCLWSLTCCRPCSSKVLTVQVVHTDLLQFVHFRYCWSPSLIHQPAPTLEGGKLWWLYGEFCWFALSFCQSLLCKSMQSSLFLRHAAKRGDVGFCFSVVPKLWWTRGALKIHREHKRADVVCSHVMASQHQVSWHCCLSLCFQVDDFTISILKKMKRNCTVSICNPLDVVSSYTLITHFCGNSREIVLMVLWFDGHLNQKRKTLIDLNW